MKISPVTVLFSPLRWRQFVGLFAAGLAVLLCPPLLADSAQTRVSPFF